MYIQILQGLNIRLHLIYRYILMYIFLFAFLQHSQSNSHDVALINLNRNLSGIYKCEVTEDHPRYETKWNQEFMSVVGM